MLNFERLLKLKIVVLAVAVALLAESSVYGVGLSDGKHLRIPLTGTARWGWEVFKDEGLKSAVYNIIVVASILGFSLGLFGKNGLTVSVFLKTTLVTDKKKTHHNR